MRDLPVTDVRRPRFHITAEAGWVNDPHGLIWSGGEYHVFFQHVPGRTVWEPACHWAHAVSPDLARWTRHGIALAPEQETGCWTGTVIRPTAAPPVAYYTSTQAPDFDHGRVRIAEAVDETLDAWIRPPGGVLIDGPPPGSGVVALRDPFMWRLTDGTWRLIMGGGFGGVGGAALQYSSPDARVWTYDGILCARDTADHSGTWTGTVWECPQLFELGGVWVFLIGVSHRDVLHYVAAATGDYDGTTFSPRQWTRLSAGDSAYAATGFLDEQGLRCLMFWLREAPIHDPAASPWAGALSVVQVLTAESDGRLALTPHPALTTLRRRGHRRDRHTVTPGGGTLSVEVPDHAVDVELTLTGAVPHTAATLTLATHGQQLAALTVHFDTGQGHLDRPGLDRHPLPVHVHNSRLDLRVVLDGDVLEVFTGIGVGAWRLGSQPGILTVTLSVETGEVTLAEMVVHEMDDGLV